MPYLEKASALYRKAISDEGVKTTIASQITSEDQEIYDAVL
jgi:hypothetical protein